MVSNGGVYLYHTMTPIPNLRYFWVIFVEGGPEFCLQQSFSAMHLNEAVPPWRRKVGGKVTTTR